MGYREPQTPGIGGLNQLTASEITLLASLDALGNPGANRLLGWDNTDTAYKFFTLGSGLSYDHATHTLSATGSSGATTALDNLASVAINTGLILGVSDGGALGSTTKMWSDLFLASGAVVNFNAGDVTITHAADNLLFAGAASGYTFDAKVYPTTDDGAALGDTTHNFSDIFLASGAVLNFSNGNYTLTHSAALLTTSGALTVGGTLALGANSLTMTGSIGATGARVTKVWTADLEMTNLPSVGGVALTTTVAKLNLLTSAAGTTGTNSTNIVFSTSPTLVTPTLGVASATSLATSAASPLLLTNGQLVTIALTSQTVGGTTLTIPDFANVSDEFTFKTKAQTMSNKTFVAPVLGAATATSINGLTLTSSTGTVTITNLKTLSVLKTLSFDGTDSTTMTFPSTSATIARTDAAQSFTGVQTFPNITLPANGQILLTIPASAGQSTGPTTAAFNSGYSSTAIGDLVYLDSSGTWQKADADLSTAAEAGMLGIALTVAASGAAVTVALPGSMVFASAWNLATVGAPIYMSATAGAITLTAPTTTDSATRVIGWVIASGNTTTKIWFQPSTDYITHV